MPERWTPRVRCNVAGGLHVNGAVDTSTLTCTTCHGNSDAHRRRPAGPERRRRAHGRRCSGHLRQHGSRAPNGVGVHAAHVLGTRSRPVQCNACHTVPGTQIHKTGAATAGIVALANLSTTGGIANASYAGAGGTCSNIYCHGNFTGGAGAVATPTWKTAATLACTSCHGAPPALTAATHHPANTACATCHGAGYTGSTVVAASHVDGAVTLSRSGCTLCHGDLTQTAVAATSSAAAPGFNATRRRHHRRDRGEALPPSAPTRRTSPARAGAPPRSPAASATPFRARAMSRTRRASALAARAPR